MENQFVVVGFENPVTEKQQEAFFVFKETLEAENPNVIVKGIGGGIKNKRPIK